MTAQQDKYIINNQCPYVIWLQYIGTHGRDCWLITNKQQIHRCITACALRLRLHFLINFNESSGLVPEIIKQTASQVQTKQTGDDFRMRGTQVHCRQWYVIQDVLGEFLQQATASQWLSNAPAKHILHLFEKLCKDRGRRNQTAERTLPVAVGSQV